MCDESKTENLPLGQRQGKACGEQVETKPEWYQGRHDAGVAGTLPRERWNPIPFTGSGGGQFFVVPMSANPKPANLAALTVAQDPIILIDAGRPNIQALIYLLEIQARMEGSCLNNS